MMIKLAKRHIALLQRELQHLKASQELANDFLSYHIDCLQEPVVKEDENILIMHADKIRILQTYKETNKVNIAETQNILNIYSTLLDFSEEDGILPLSNENETKESDTDS